MCRLAGFRGPQSEQQQQGGLVISPQPRGRNSHNYLKNIMSQHRAAEHLPAMTAHREHLSTGPSSHRHIRNGLTAHQERFVGTLGTDRRHIRNAPNDHSIESKGGFARFFPLTI